MNPQEDEQQSGREESNKSRNLDIVDKFRSFFERFPSEIDEEYPLTVKLLRFHERSREDRKVWLKVNTHDRYQEVDDFDNSPSDFVPPIYLVYPHYYRGEDKYFESFHPLMGFSFKGKAYPEWIIGSDGKIYHFYNDYYFDTQGEARKVEEVRCSSDFEGMDPEEFLDTAFGNRRSLVQKFEFESNEMYLKHEAELTEGDYERIEAYIKGIELGQFELEAPVEEG